MPTDAATPDLVIFWLVVVGRLLLPLFAAVLIVIDSLIGLRTAGRSGRASSIVWSFAWLAVANEAIVAVGRLTRGDEQLALGSTICFVGLLTLIVTLYDRYEPYRGVRLEESPQGA